jgi:uncharacterized RDD family membrane protein YckC
MHKIELAPLWKRALASLTDLFICFSLFVGFFALAQWLFTANAYTSGLQDELARYEVDSHLYHLDSDNEPAVFDFSSYDSYQSIVVSYYTEYLVSECPEASRHAGYSLYWYNVHILGLEDAKGLYAPEDLAARGEPSKTTGPTLFVYETANGSPSYDVLAVPSASLYSAGSLTDEAKTQLLHFYWDENSVSVYYNAASDLAKEDFFKDVNDRYSAQETTYPLLTAFPLAALVCYFIIPLCFHDGETLGKKIFHLCLVNKIGFRIQRNQIILRQLPAVAFFEVFFFFVGQYIAVMVALLFLFVSYLIMIFDKKHRALHDFWSLSLVVDKEKSLFYENLAEQEAGEQDFSKVMAEAAAVKENGEKALAAEKEEK